MQLTDDTGSFWFFNQSNVELVINEILTELVALVETSGDIKLLLDFENVEHLSSAALGMLITLNKRVGEAKGQLRLSNIAPPIFEVFKITKLHKVFDVEKDEPAARKAFLRKGIFG